MKGKPKPRAGKGFLAWRSRQKRGAIMKPSTFEEIKSKDGRNPEAVAGAAYWKAARAKYRAYQHHKYSKKK